MAIRKAGAVWNGGLKGGNGTFNTESGLGGKYSFGSRFESAGGSNPEELLAAAEAACFSMALGGDLEKNGTPATKVDIVAYLLLANGFPSGDSDLPLDPGTLDNLQIAKKGAEASGPPNFSLVQVLGCALVQRSPHPATARKTAGGQGVSGVSR